MTNPPTASANTDERIFEHTGIRIMRSNDGAIMFCDPGLNTGVRDYFIIEPQTLKDGRMDILESGLLRYIQTHERARTNDQTFSFSPHTDAQ